MAYSTSGIATSFFVTIPPAQHKTFTRHMRMRFGTCDRFGYGSRGTDVEPGYDRTWACMIQMGTPDAVLANLRRPPLAGLPPQFRGRLGGSGKSNVQKKPSESES